MTQPVVSVLIPCRNAEAYIAETLESVLAQSWCNREIIVVDDGSTDGSAARVEAFVGRGVRLVRQGASGAAAARNRALAECGGDFIQFLDADDLVDPDKIALQVARLAEQPECVATAEWGRFYNTPEETVFAAEPTWEDLDPIEWLLRSRADGWGMLFPALWLVPRAVAERAGPWNEALTLGDDGEYFTRVVLASERVLFCKGARCRYRSGIPDSLSKSKDWESGFAVLDLCEREVVGRTDTERARRAFSISWQLLAYACYPFDRHIADLAMTRARALHPVRMLPDGGLRLRAVSRLIGWRAARRLQVALGRN